MINILEEQEISLKELKNYHLKDIRKMIDERLDWRLTTENYDHKKVNNLLKNIEVVNDLITNLVINDSIESIDTDYEPVIFTQENL